MTGLGVGAGDYEGVRGLEGDFVCVERADGVACEAKESTDRYEEDTEEEGLWEGLEGGEAVGSRAQCRKSSSRHEFKANIKTTNV